MCRILSQLNNISELWAWMMTKPTFKYSDILWKFGYLPIPGIGIVRSLYTPASPDWTTSLFKAPSLEWHFSVWESEQEEQLFQSQHPDLWSTMAKVSERWIQDIQNGKEVSINGIGILKHNVAGLPIFFQDNESSLVAYYAMLPNVPFTLPGNKVTQIHAEPSAVPKLKSKSRFFSRSKIFAAVSVLLLLFTVWWLSTPDYAEQEIPNGRVNLKPGDNYGIDSVNAERRNDTAVLPDESANLNVAPKDTEITMDSVDLGKDPCYVVLGSFLNKDNSQRLKQELIRKGLTVELMPYDSFTRVSVLIECRESAEKLMSFRSTFNSEAWLLD
jgi:hypothetical protein